MSGGYLIKCPHDAPCMRVCTVCTSSLLSELEQWRTGKRRVFWRVRKPGSVQDFAIRSEAWAEWQRGFRFTSRPGDDNVCGVTRVTVRPKTAGPLFGAGSEAANAMRLRPKVTP